MYAHPYSGVTAVGSARVCVTSQDTQASRVPQRGAGVGMEAVHRAWVGVSRVLSSVCVLLRRATMQEMAYDTLF